MVGIFQSGSETATRAVGSLAGSGFVGVLMSLLRRRRPEALAGADSEPPMPELTLISSWPSFLDFLSSSASESLR